ncbi:uncharacterized protein [Coffea arabica]|uniref:Tf2-1-like SH3-like domain-containing protein n=1 Tax=Coffea arabica TaxID=13443 RepID=A0ABM4X4R2_COFAR
MKQKADRLRSDRSFAGGDLVYLKLQPYRQTNVALRRNLKLSAKYYGPFKALQKVGPVAYKLELPTGSAIHPMFHVSQLKPFTKGEPVQYSLPSLNEQGEVRVAPQAVLERRTKRRGGQATEQVLILWENLN